LFVPSVVPQYHVSYLRFALALLVMLLTVLIFLNELFLSPDGGSGGGDNPTSV
jgi:hypothetical protein